MMNISLLFYVLMGTVMGLHAAVHDYVYKVLPTHSQPVTENGPQLQTCEAQLPIKKSQDLEFQNADVQTQEPQIQELQAQKSQEDILQQDFIAQSSNQSADEQHRNQVRDEVLGKLYLMLKTVGVVMYQGIQGLFTALLGCL